MGGILLGGVDLFLGQLIVGNRIEPLDTGGHVTIGDALHLKLVQPAEIADLTEAERGVVDQPNSSCFGH